MILLVPHLHRQPVSEYPGDRRFFVGVTGAAKLALGAAEGGFIFIFWTIPDNGSSAAFFFFFFRGCWTITGVVGGVGRGGKLPRTGENDPLEFGKGKFPLRGCWLGDPWWNTPSKLGSEEKFPLLGVIGLENPLDTSGLILPGVMGGG